MTQFDESDPSMCNVYDEGAFAVDDFVWKHRDMLVLFAAGNDGANGNFNTQTVGRSVSIL